MHLSNVHFVLRDISALLDPSWFLVVADFNSLSVEALERRGEKAWKGGVRRLRPKFWQRTKCTFRRPPDY